MIPGRPARRAPGVVRGIVLLASMLGVPGGSAVATDEIGIAQFGIERWTESDGLDSNWVRDVVEGPDGSMWIATGNGLLRFDGRSFDPFAGSGPARSSLGSVAALARGSGGRLWIALEYGGIRMLPAAGSPQAVPVPSLPDDLPATVLLEDPAGILWIGTSAGLWRVEGETAARIAPNAAAHGAEVRALATSPHGEVWVRTRDHGLWRIVGDAVEVVPDPPACRGAGIAIGPGDARYTSCLDGVWRWDPVEGRWLRISAGQGVGRLHTDRRGDLWFGEREGLARWTSGSFKVLPMRSGLGDWRVRAFAENARGDLWIGTYSGGLARLYRGPVRAYGAPEGLVIDGTSAVLAMPDGGVLIGALDRGLLSWHPDHGVRARWTPQEGLPGAVAWALAPDPRRPGGIWVGGDSGIAWLEEGTLRRIGPGGIAHADATRILHADAAQADTLWVAGETGGVIELRPGERIAHDAARGLPLQRVRFVHRDRSGRLLAGGEEGLYAYDGRVWSEQRVGGRTTRGLKAILEDDGGGLWLASGRDGLVHVAGDRSSTYGLDDGLPFRPIHSLAFDAAGGLWMSGDQGLARLRLHDHARWERGELASVPVERLGRRDGMRDAECNGWGRPAVTRLTDGRFVFPTVSGIAVLDPGALPTVELAPAEIYIQSAASGPRELALDRPLQLAANERSLRIAFSAIELLRPEALGFRYRLDGFDADWIPATRASEANWSHLVPGSYAFRLQARLPGRDWVDAAQVLAVEVEPQPWESPWLRAAALSLALLLVAAAFGWRLRIESRHARTLGRARAFLREVIDTSPNPIFARRRDGSYALANRAAATFYGLSPGELEGRSPRQLGTSPEGMARVDVLDAEVFASAQERILAEDRIVDHEGRQRWFRIVKRPGFGADGKTVEQVIGMAVDVTEFKLAEQRLQREQARLRRSRGEARRLARRLLRAQEDERQRLAREIHDDLTQQLAGLAMLAWSTAQAIAREPSRDVTGNLAELASELERVANEVQALSRDLHPPALESLGLAGAVRAECETFAKRTGMAISFECPGDFDDPAPEVGLALYRIVQEGLRNCLAHAGSNEARVTMARDAGGIRLEVIDHGVGFDAAAAMAQPGLGLASMQERARLAGASFRIESARGAGTRLVVIVRVRPAPRGTEAEG
ncbi:MAG: PAS domain S-box protein [Xanthomonadales bacterium]|nr:PAS domain S-box protein [Xanthomonadales bacterium]